MLFSLVGENLLPPFPLQSSGVSLPLPWVVDLDPRVLHYMPSGISWDAESTLKYAHQPALTARKVLLSLGLVPPALRLLGRGTQKTETAHSREEASQMQW